MEAITKEEAEELHATAWEKAKKKKAEKAKQAIKDKQEKAKQALKDKAARAKAIKDKYLGWRPGDKLLPTRQKGPPALDLDKNQVKFTQGTKVEGAVLNETVLAPPGMELDDEFWGGIADKAVGEVGQPSGPMSTGVVVAEPDGRIWVVEPKGHYGGYTYTYPKGGWKPGGPLTVQQRALKEVYQESGLLAEIDTYLGDYVSEKTGGITRYYMGHRTGGAPWAFGAESQAVYLAELETAGTMVHTKRDLQVLEEVVERLGQKGKVKLPSPVIPAAPTYKPKPAPKPTPATPVKPPPRPSPTAIPATEIPPQALPEALAEGIFPESVEGMHQVRSLGGTTGAQLVKDPATGRLYVLKRGASAGHIRSEAIADELYRRLGVRVPSYRLYETPTGPVKLAEYIPDATSLSEMINTASVTAQEEIFDQLREGLVTDCWLGNWDVLGLDYDNILVDKNGLAWRIDNGGALFYRAQGALKAPGELNPWMRELWSMRTQAVPAGVYGKVPWDDIVAQMGRLGGLSEAELLADLPAEIADMLRARLQTTRGLWKTSTTMMDDAFAGAYVDKFAEATMDLREAGFLDRLPKELTGRGTTLLDENGIPWDELRGSDSASKWLADYMRENDANFEIVRSWASDQAGSSYGQGPLAFKRWLAKTRGIDLDQYWWGPGGKSGADDALASVLRGAGAETYDRTMTLWHAANYEFLQYTPLPYSDPSAGITYLMRTVPEWDIHNAGLKKGEIGYMIQGGNESSSLLRSVSVKGYEMTLQAVPHHRITGGYWWERKPGSGAGAFMGDSENELTFIPQGLPTYYWGTAGGMSKGAERFWTTEIMNRLLRALAGGR